MEWEIDTNTVSRNWGDQTDDENNFVEIVEPILSVNFVVSLLLFGF